MHTRILPLISAAVFGLALASPPAHAQLLLSGHTTGSFDNPMLANTTVVNAADGSSAMFTTGIPVWPNKTPTSVSFTDQSFANISSGEAIQAGLFTIHNGSDVIGSDAANAVFHLGLQLTSPTMQTVNLAPITISIDNTINNNNTPVPDIFGVSFTQPAAMVVDGYNVLFHINFSPTDLSVPENTTMVKGDVTVTFTPFTPVPEPATYAIWGAALLLGLIAYRFARSNRSIPLLPTSSAV